MKWLLKLLPIQFKIWLYKLLYNDIAEKGEAEDTELAHINEFEAQLLKRVGGLGKKNPITGLRGFLGGGGGGGPAPAPAPSQPEKTTQITREAPEIEARKLALFDEATELGSMPIPVPAIQVAPPSPLQQQQFAQAAGLASLGQPAFQQGIGSVQQAQTVAQQMPDIMRFMNPFQSFVTDEINRQAEISRNQLASQAIQSGAFGGGREGVAQGQYASDAAKNRAALQAQLLGQGFTQANQLANQAFTQQQNLGDFSRNLASLQPSLAASGVQQLGAAGTGNLAYQQAQLAYNEPLSRLNAFGSGIASQASGSPTTTTNTTLGGAGTVGPLSQALSAGLSAYGLGSIFGGR